ncbi:hypothetical protein [Psychroserpens sp. SPM9]|nr:hypothetical protein [Psychroserpens sp. SPM9]MDG5491221.1 hypothetical protein [Psychroserpens sp. SPM9]
MKKKSLEGVIPKLTTHNIYLNVNHLEKGSYKLKIVLKNKIIKSTYFTKD